MRKVWVTSTAYLVFAGIVYGDDQSWERIMREARELQRSGAFAEAETQFSRALQVALSGKRNSRVARSLSGLGSVNQDLGRYGDAENFYLRAIQLLDGEAGSKDPSLSEPLAGLASLYHETRQYTKAETLTLRCLALEECAFPETLSR